MAIRVTLYAVILVTLFFIGVWLAFGPLQGALLESFLLPGRAILWILRWDEGSDPGSDILAEGMLSFAVWFVAAVLVDVTFTLLRRRSRPAV